MLFSLFAAIIVFFNVASADRTVVVLYNNGVASATSGSCNAADLVKTDAVIEKSTLNTTYGYQRYLRTNDVEDKDDMTESMLLEQSGHRDLIIYPKRCKNDCALQTSGFCQAAGCVGYRRRHLGENGNRNLLSGSAFTCTQQVGYINAELTKLATQTNDISSGCKTLLMKPRNITCFDDVIYGVVESFKLWDTDASPQKVIIENYTGQDIERGRKINFQVMTNDCVDFLLTTLTGPNGYYEDSSEYSRPFSVFGDSYATNGLLYGNQLPLGQYELTALPDGLIEKKKVLKFNVVPGTVTAVRLWDTTANAILNPNFTGGNVCNSKEITFEAVMPYAKTSKITLACTALAYSKSNTEASAPFSIFNNDSNGDFYGKTLQNGLYTLTIYPDEVASNKVKTITFNVVNCP